ncbi:hypothetical protein EI94DRAFT_1772886 [Lactarius quietus]|nr:hypothetical protein EI94DRAFT_1772886 [Lactarius quietus]
MSASSSGSHRGRRGGGPQGRENRGGRGGRGGATGNGRGRGGTPTPPIDRAGVPRGICNFYWSTGACNRLFDCTYKHEVKPQVLVTPSVSATDGEDQLEPPDFFSREGLALNNGSVVDARHTLRPNEAHNHLKRYLADYFVFRDANNVEGFSRIFASVNSRNAAWGNALFRIGDVLRFSPVAVNVGAGSSTLSYQKGYFPFIEACLNENGTQYLFFSSDLVLKTTMHRNTNQIYALLDQNYDDFHSTTRKCMREMIESRTWRDSTPGLPEWKQNTLSGVEVFETLSTVLSQYFARVKSAMKNHPELHVLVEDIFSWFDIWTAAVQASPPTFQDPITNSSPLVRNLTLGKLEKGIDRLRRIVGREYGDTEKMRRHVPNERFTSAQMQEALASRLEQTYDPPDIRNIRIAPTNDELLCPLPPYLPVFLPTAPHHLPGSSMERHFDIQFRLLREEMIASIRQSVGEVRRDLETMSAAPGARPKTKRPSTLLEKLLSSKGGSYKTSGHNSVFFQLYTGARFAPLKAERRNFTVGLVLDSPPGAPRDKDKKRRADYWEHSKRLQQGSLVALALISPSQFQVFLGTIISNGSEIAESAKADDTKENTVQIRISFFDAEIELMALRGQPISVDNSTFAVLIDNKIMFEALHPFLRTLKEAEPTDIPFSDLISHSGNLALLPVGPPLYARAPGFKYNLQCLARSGQKIWNMDANNATSVAIARQELRRSSALDPSQVDAVIGTLTREVSLIQGPPGTGKSFTGKEILRVLFASKIKPIVLIAFTNHALDHMLTSVLDAKITNNVVRLGSRTSDARIEEYSLFKLEQRSNGGDLDRTIKREYATMKQAEKDITRIVNRIQLPLPTSADADGFLRSHYPHQADSLKEPPFWIEELFRRNTEKGWTEVRGRNASRDVEIAGLYGFWKNCRDIQYIQHPPSSGKKPSPGEEPSSDDELSSDEEETNTDPRVAFFNEVGLDGLFPPVPSGNRSLGQLIGIDNVWSMSRHERQRLSKSWEDDMRKLAYRSRRADFERLRKHYKDACKSYEDTQDEARRRLLKRTDLIACTTTGAAKLVSLLTSVGPKVLMVEEAGQVLEAHILASLVTSVEHLICIGDPKQLRPNLANFAFSMDSTSGRELFKFDRSLMERLSDGGTSMSQINMQRRMRPGISHFVRTILYPKLEDNDVVRHYPAVQGMEKDVYFFSHNHPENSEEDSVSKHNMFEVAMIRDLVLYFLKQGPYDGAGDIAVLCAYLGQLQKVRAALKDLKIAVSVDERDEEQLEVTGLAGDDDIGFAQVEVARHVGTTADFWWFTLLILVKDSHRNGQGASIGFLKSSNRINVALSRAKHGLYILGNASNLRKNETWRTVLDEMEKEDQLGYGFPIICPRHPNARQIISMPGQIPLHAPEGGCIRPCEYRMSCGHLCPSKCHTDQDNHKRMKCNHPCVRVTCPRAHPCPLLCCEPCGDCKFPVYGVKFPCGHIAKSVFCHQLEKLDTVNCVAQVSKRLPGCEHIGIMACSKDPTRFCCKEICGGNTTCCGRTCKARCHECPKVTSENAAPDAGALPPGRTHHKSHPCERTLKCQHICGLRCSSDHSCDPKCSQSCRQRCAHQNCKKKCWEPCPPCMEPCEWRCPHHSCPLVCGSPCEQQKCVECLPKGRKVDIVDFITQRRLDEIDLTPDKVAMRTHFTVETLDSHCKMSDYYELDALGAFTATKAPPVSFQTPPVCPTCRGPITALRYGRVTKRASLDNLEQNVASTMSSDLEKVGLEIRKIWAKLDAAKGEAKSIAFNPPTKAAENFDKLSAKRRTRFGSESEPLPDDEISQASMTKIHGFAKKEGNAWSKVVCDHLNLYRTVTEVARTRGPHVQAYGAALATLYRLELSGIADTRFQVEAFLLSLELRYTLAEIAQSRIEGLKESSTKNEISHERLWRSFVSFIFESCIRDAEKAVKIAEKSSASRLAARAGMYILRGKLELFRFEILAERTLLSREGLYDEDRRNELSAKAQLEADTATLEMKKLEMTYMSKRRVTSLVDLKSEKAWFTVNCRAKGDKFLEEYNALATHLQVAEGGYELMSLKEKRDIIKALGLSPSGHYNNCENGHTFVIGECGGAMQEARCPECNAPIGGSHHRLHQSNTRAMEFEEIARGGGA